MRTSRLFLTLTVLLGLAAASTTGQTLDGRNQVGLTIGFWNQVTDVTTEIGDDGVTTSVDNSGAMGTVYYEHWFKEHLAFNIGIGGMTPDISVSVGVPGVTTKTAYIGHIFLGLKYYLPASTYGSSVRPYALVAAGPVIGTIDEIQVGTLLTTESRSHVTIAGKLGGGVDFPVSRHFIIGVGAAYRLMADFSEPVGGSKNYSGPEFGISFGYLFGG